MENVTVAETPRRRLPLWVIMLAFVGLLVFLGLIAWGLRRANEGPILIGDRVPPITLTTFEGQTIQTTDLAGKVIVLNFWASWCQPCEQEAAALEESWQRFKPGGKVVFVGVDYVDTEPEAKGFLKKFGITYPNGPDLRTVISQMFRIRGVPETYIIDRDGKLGYAKIGPFDSASELMVAIDGLLK